MDALPSDHCPHRDVEVTHDLKACVERAARTHRRRLLALSTREPGFQLPPGKKISKYLSANLVPRMSARDLMISRRTCGADPATY